MGRHRGGDPPGDRREQALTAFIDTNVLIRHLTGDPPELAERATAALAGDEPWLLTDIVAAETVYVLESYYGVDRVSVATALRSAFALPSIEVVDLPALLRALEVYEVERLDFAEAFLVAWAELTGVRRVLSFDRSLDRIGSVTRVGP